jgi:hypothetical protein
MADLKIEERSSNGSSNLEDVKHPNDLKVDLDKLRAKIDKTINTPQRIKIGKYTIEEIDGKLMISDGSFKFSINEMYDVLVNHCEALKVLINDKGI